MRDHSVNWLPQPDVADIDIGTVLHALADPIRLRIIRELAKTGESTCSNLDLPIKVSTVSHHMRILRESGVTSTKIDGTARPSLLRIHDLQTRFPGLLPAILAADAAPGEPGTTHR